MKPGLQEGPRGLLRLNPNWLTGTEPYLQASSSVCTPIRESRELDSGNEGEGSGGGGRALAQTSSCRGARGRRDSDHWLFKSDGERRAVSGHVRTWSVTELESSNLWNEKKVQTSFHLFVIMICRNTFLLLTRPSAFEAAFSFMSIWSILCVVCFILVTFCVFVSLWFMQILNGEKQKDPFSHRSLKNKIFIYSRKVEILHQNFTHQYFRAESTILNRGWIHMELIQSQ